MPYSREEPISDMFMRITPPLLDDVKELQLALVRMHEDKEAWKRKYQTLEVSYSIKLKVKDDLIEILESHPLEMMEKQEDLFSSRVHPVAIKNIAV